VQGPNYDGRATFIGNLAHDGVHLGHHGRGRAESKSDEFDARVRLPFLTSLVDRLKNQFPTIDIFNSFACVFSPSRYPLDQASLENYGRRELGVLLDHFGEEHSVAETGVDHPAMIKRAPVLQQFGSFKQWMFTERARFVSSSTAPTQPNSAALDSTDVRGVPTKQLAAERFPAAAFETLITAKGERQKTDAAVATSQSAASLAASLVATQIERHIDEASRADALANASGAMQFIPVSEQKEKASAAAGDAVADHASVPMAAMTATEITRRFFHHGSGGASFCPAFFQLLEMMAVMVPTTTECERDFSVMKYLKDSLRNRMTNTTLESLMRVLIHGPRFRGTRATPRDHIDTFLKRCVRRWLAQDRLIGFDASLLV
jgi:hypothetical protein